MINKETVNIGEPVYVLGMGPGIVQSVDRTGGFSVKIKGGEVQSFSRGGYVGKRRRVYWHNPLVMDPPKDKRLWAAYTRLATSVWNELVALHNAGYQIEADDDAIELVEK